jgi:hypothetical protein
VVSIVHNSSASSNSVSTSDGTYPTDKSTYT